MSILVANDKLLDLSPTWRRYAGWTVLFAPQRAGAVPAATLYDVADESPTNRAAYTALATAVGDHVVGLSDGLALLPPATYHVTVCDGLSPMHDGKVPLALRAELARRLAGLADAADIARRHAASGLDVDLAHVGFGPQSAAATEELVAVASAGPVRVRVSGVAVRGTAVLAELQPDTDDAGTTERIAAIGAARTSLLDVLGAATGGELRTPWRPHVTLAYAANHDLAKRLASPVAALSEPIAGALSGHRLVFAEADVFAFTDMVTFVRRDHRPQALTCDAVR